MSESRQIVQFAEMARQAVETLNPAEAEVMAWLGDADQVMRGKLPAAVFTSYCPGCKKVMAHLVQNTGRLDLYVCLACGFVHS